MDGTHIILTSSQFAKLYPVLRMGVMSLRILCYAGLERARRCQFAIK